MPDNLKKLKLGLNANKKVSRLFINFEIGE